MYVALLTDSISHIVFLDLLLKSKKNSTFSFAAFDADHEIFHVDEATTAHTGIGAPPNKVQCPFYNMSQHKLGQTCLTTGQRQQENHL
jgi:hypothetical protein